MQGHSMSPMWCPRKHTPIFEWHSHTCQLTSELGWMWWPWEINTCFGVKQLWSGGSSDWIRQYWSYLLWLFLSL
jgi:hypothetical protein